MVVFFTFTSVRTSSTRLRNVKSWKTVFINLSFPSGVFHCCFLFPGMTAPSRPGSHHCRGFTVTLRHTKIGRTVLDEWSARRRDLCLKTTHNIHPCPRRDSNPQSQQASGPDSFLRRRGHWDRLCVQPVHASFLLPSAWCCCCALSRVASVLH